MKRFIFDATTRRDWTPGEDAVTYVLYMDAKMEIEALRWLVEVQEVYMEMYALDADHVTELDGYAYDEIVASYIAARSAAVI